MTPDALARWRRLRPIVIVAGWVGVVVASRYVPTGVAIGFAIAMLVLQNFLPGCSADRCRVDSKDAAAPGAPDDSVQAVGQRSNRE